MTFPLDPALYCLAKEELIGRIKELEERLLEHRRSAPVELEQEREARRRFELRLDELKTSCEEAQLGWELERSKSVTEGSAIKASLERLSAEKKVWELIAANFRKKARTLVEKLQREKDELEQEVRLLKKLTPATVSHHPEYHATGKQHSPFAALGMTAQTAHAGIAAAIAGSGADFRHDPSIETIRYRTADQVIELYGSANIVQTAPFGRRSQKCSAYICVVQRETAPHVYLAWQLIDEGVALFCLPEKQPSGAGSYARVVQDALYYFESVGFMMDRFELTRGSERQLSALEKTGICRRDPSAEFPEEIADIYDIWHLNVAA